MNKMKYILIILVMMVFLSGCTIRSDVVVSPNGTTTEKVQVLTDTKTFESEKYSKKEMIEFSMEPYLSVLNFREYSYNTVIGNTLSGAEVSKTYDNICSYFQDTAFNQYVYHHINCEENEYYYEIKNDTEYIPYCSNCSNWPALDDVEIKITLPVSAEEQNADEINGNTYIWKYDENTQNKDFYLKISKSALKQSEETYNENINQKKRANIVTILTFIVIFIVVILLLVFILYRKYKRNKLDY